MATIMVVDDTAFMRTILGDLLTKMGHEVVGKAANGQEAIRLYMQLKPDLVTMDITMPEMDGVTALKQIRKADPEAKVIMCSAIGQHAMVIDAITAGAKDFIVKPLQMERVVTAIERVFK